MKTPNQFIIDEFNGFKETTTLDTQRLGAILHLLSPSISALMTSYVIYALEELPREMPSSYGFSGGSGQTVFEETAKMFLEKFVEKINEEYKQ